MNADETLESLLGKMLRSVPESWEDYDPSALSALREHALSALAAAGMIERRVTLRLRMIGHPVAVEATITLTGETGLAQAMQFVLADIWTDWREAYERHRSGELKDSPISHCERIGVEQWRLTAEGVVARNDLNAGDATTVIDFVLRRGLFDGTPRMLPDGRISQRLPVAGKGSLVRMQRITGEVQAGVTILNWETGAQAFAAAFSEFIKTKPPIAEVPASTGEKEPSLKLLSVYSNGMSDERMKQAAQVLSDEKLTANEKLTKIDGLMPFPPTASAEQLGEILGVSKQAVMKTVWWRKNRRGETQKEIDDRFQDHEDRRGTPIDRRRVNRKESSSDDDDDDR
ncbi:MAG: hypothetical protein FJ261_14550 [Planctomycetes bacterium]|nr:hypothetical protein [Planctomycetota bacterium]